MAFLKTKSKQLTAEQREELLQKIGNNLSDQELILLQKAIKDNAIKQMALKKLKTYFLT